MAVTSTNNPKKKVEGTFSKKQILLSSKFTKRRDLLDVLLDDSKQYSLEEVETAINNFMKGQVK